MVNMMKVIPLVLVAALVVLVSCSPAPAYVIPDVEVMVVDIKTAREVHLKISVPTVVDVKLSTMEKEGFILGIDEGGKVCIYGRVDQVEELKIKREGTRWYKEVKFYVYREDANHTELCGRVEGGESGTDKNLVVVYISDSPKPKEEGR
jgi:hypothetical protein